MASDLLMQWILILEYYGPKIYYITEPENTVADDMRRIPMVEDNAEVKLSYDGRSLLQEVHLNVYKTQLDIVH